MLPYNPVSPKAKLLIFTDKNQINIDKNIRVDQSKSELIRSFVFDKTVWASSFSLAATGEIKFFSFPPGTEMFHFPGCALFAIKTKVVEVYSTGFPHSEISGSKVATHLPEAYRSYATSFIAS